MRAVRERTISVLLVIKAAEQPGCVFKDWSFTRIGSFPTVLLNTNRQ